MAERPWTRLPIEALYEREERPGNEFRDSEAPRTKCLRNTGAQHTLSGYVELNNERASTLAWESLIWAWLFASISGYHISLPGLSDGKVAASSILPGSSLRMSSGSVGSWRELHLRNHKNIPTWLITSSVPCARSVGSVPLLEDGRRTLGPNTVAKLFCPILFWSWCTLNLSNNYYKFKLEKQT